MSSHLLRAVRFTTLGVVVVISPFGAQALTVGRCNQLIDGVYRPVLVVKNDDQKTIYQIGEDGLTRSIAFDADAALAWTSEKYGAAASSVYYDDSCINGGGSDATPLVVVGPGPGPGPVPGPGGGDCGGGDCGGGDCGGGDCGGGDCGGGDCGGGDCGGGDCGGGDCGGSDSISGDGLRG